jgi:streptogramin lyase
LRSAICHLQFAICNLLFAICNLPFAQEPPMPTKPLRLTLTLASAIILALLAGVSSAASIPVEEADLPANSIPYHINRHADGDFLVSIDGIAKIWKIDPATGSYAVYGAADFNDLTSPIDARSDGAGTIWFSDWTNGTLGRLELGNPATLTTWPLTGASYPWGVALDPNGDVWVTDAVLSRVFQFTPRIRRLCIYTLPAGGSSEHILFLEGQLWLGDYNNARILRLDPAAGQIEWWNLPPEGFAYPLGLAFDAAGHLWWADFDRANLARLEPAADTITTYDLPTGSQPTMIALQGGLVWYTESGADTVGGLDPAIASGSSQVMATGSQAVSPSCSGLAPGNSVTATTATGALSWIGDSWSEAPGDAGWSIAQMPSGSEPYGIVSDGEELWVADQGRKKLIRLPMTAPPVLRDLYLPIYTRSTR